MGINKFRVKNYNNCKGIGMKYILSMLLVAVVFASACTSTGQTTVQLLKNVQQQSQGEQSSPENMVGNEIGQAPPDFTVTATDGKTITLSEFSKDKPTVLYFMATWCPYCRQDYSTLMQVFPEYEDKINFLSISLDLTENHEILRNYKNSKYVPGELAPGARDILIAYGVQSTTTKYLIKDNEIIFKNAGAMNADQWRRLLDALLSA